ncbi:MAG TPA: T3SS effector HopA1 family protein [Frankiaceae bacterium]|nr:T3SS effector HopA1 family protein [Frankiaceae bacterium]
MTAVHPALAAAARRVRVVTPGEVAVGGDTYALPVSDPPGERRGLGDIVYTRIYLGLRRATHAASVEEHEDPRLGRALRAATRGWRSADPGWVVAGESGDDVLVRRDGLTAVAPRADVVPPDAMEGDAVTVLAPSARPYASPGFFTVVGRSGPPDGELARVYVNVAADGAARLVRSLARALDGVPYVLKVANHPGAYRRRDTAVLYVATAALEGAAPAVAGAVERLAPWLRGPVPAFTYRWRPGVGVAVDPGGNGLVSFGQHRSLLVAGGILAAWHAGSRAVDDAIAGEFADAGLDPLHPYAGVSGMPALPRWEAA